MSVVVHPTDPAVPQSEPVNPPVHMQEQVPRATTLVPPLRQVRSVRHFSIPVFAESLLLKTKSSRGTAIAAMMMQRRRIVATMTAQSGNPQLRRLGLPSLFTFSALPFGPDFSGHPPCPSQEDRLGPLLNWGVDTGGGNAASISDSPDAGRPPRVSARPSLSCFSLSKSLRVSIRLVGRLPLSIMAASLVALRIRSGKLVRLPRDSASLTASMSMRSPRFMAELRVLFADELWAMRKPAGVLELATA